MRKDQNNENNKAKCKKGNCVGRDGQAACFLIFSRLVYFNPENNKNKNKEKIKF